MTSSKFGLSICSLSTGRQTRVEPEINRSEHPTFADGHGQGLFEWLEIDHQKKEEKELKDSYMYAWLCFQAKIKFNVG